MGQQSYTPFAECVWLNHFAGRPRPPGRMTTVKRRIIRLCSLSARARFALDLTCFGSIRRRDPISSYPTRSIEVFPVLRRCWSAHDQLSLRLINVGFVAEADFYFG